MAVLPLLDNTHRAVLPAVLQTPAEPYLTPAKLPAKRQPHPSTPQSNPIHSRTTLVSGAIVPGQAICVICCVYMLWTGIRMLLLLLLLLLPLQVRVQHACDQGHGHCGAPGGRGGAQAGVCVCGGGGGNAGTNMLPGCVDYRVPTCPSKFAGGRQDSVVMADSLLGCTPSVDLL